VAREPPKLTPHPQPLDPLAETAKAKVDDILWDVAEGAVARMGLEDFVFYLFDAEREHLVQRAAFGPKNPRARELANPIRLRVGTGIVGAVALTGKLIRLDDTRLDARYVYDDSRRLSELTVPMWYGGRVIGVLDSEHSQLAFFTPLHEQTFTTIAAVTASRLGRSWMR
jgi:putative methionine-R-sulfoxide reductase with GAF domain